ncbi:hypothetical protein AAX28_01641 [Arcobacter porcinus]|uniref:Integrase catalytic domain-containing protein n=1 Tax=Arcobacter porcinus TaxID=1935204 RepID=A0ABX2YAQ5_9BACT|nr:hypothetical protein AAX28_01641 [Arcobacter porcinus]
MSIIDIIVMIEKTIFHTRTEARDKIFEYIEMFYNSKRRHSFLDFISPNEFEKRYNDSATQHKVLTD